jgi:hypothetical protein
MAVVLASPAQAQASFSAPTNFDAGDQSESVAVGDFNGDSKPDLATANAFSDNVSVLLNETNAPAATNDSYTASLEGYVLWFRPSTALTTTCSGTEWRCRVRNPHLSVRTHDRMVAMGSQPKGG